MPVGVFGVHRQHGRLPPEPHRPHAGRVDEVLQLSLERGHFRLGVPLPEGAQEGRLPQLQGKISPAPDPDPDHGRRAGEAAAAHHMLDHCLLDPLQPDAGGKHLQGAAVLRPPALGEDVDLRSIPVRHLPRHGRDVAAGVVTGVLPGEGVDRVGPEGNRLRRQPRRLGEGAHEGGEVGESHPQSDEERNRPRILADRDHALPSDPHVLQDRLQLHPGRSCLPVAGRLKRPHDIGRKDRRRLADRQS